MVSLFRIEDLLRMTDRIDLRDALREAIIAADATFASLSTKDLRIERAGDTSDGPGLDFIERSSVPVARSVQTYEGQVARAVAVEVHLNRWYGPLTLCVVGYETNEVHAIDAVTKANARIERILARAMDREAAASKSSQRCKRCDLY